MPTQGSQRETVIWSSHRLGTTTAPLLQKPHKVHQARKVIHRSYIREFNLEVLSYWVHYKIAIGPTTFRPPIQKEVSARFLIPESTICGWKSETAMENIVNEKKHQRWGEMEREKWLLAGGRRWRSYSILNAKSIGRRERLWEGDGWGKLQ